MAASSLIEGDGVSSEQPITGLGELQVGERLFVLGIPTSTFASSWVASSLTDFFACIIAQTSQRRTMSLQRMQL